MKIKPEMMHLDFDTDKRSCEAAFQTEVVWLDIKWPNYKFPEMVERGVGMSCLKLCAAFRAVACDSLTPSDSFVAAFFLMSSISHSDQESSWCPEKLHGVRHLIEVLPSQEKLQLELVSTHKTRP